MSQGERSVVLLIGGFILGMCVILFLQDFSARSPAEEKVACSDDPDRVAYMARLPGEAHTVEHCIKVMRYGSPRFIPEFSHPLKPRGES